MAKHRSRFGPYHVTLPRIGASPRSAESLFVRSPKDFDYTGVLEVDCRRSIDVSESFVDELCRQGLRVRHAKALVFIGGPSKIQVLAKLWAIRNKTNYRALQFEPLTHGKK